jgi:hypothetical protein
MRFGNSEKFGGDKEVKLRVNEAVAGKLAAANLSDLSTTQKRRYDSLMERKVFGGFGVTDYDEDRVSVIAIYRPVHVTVSAAMQRSRGLTNPLAGSKGVFEQAAHHVIYGGTLKLTEAAAQSAAQKAFKDSMDRHIALVEEQYQHEQKEAAAINEANPDANAAVGAIIGRVRQTLQNLRETSMELVS